MKKLLGERNKLTLGMFLFINWYYVEIALFH